MVCKIRCSSSSAVEVGVSPLVTRVLGGTRWADEQAKPVGLSEGLDNHRNKMRTSDKG